MTYSSITFDSIIAVSAIKHLSQAKSRLASAHFPTELRQELVLAMLHDTCDAIRSMVEAHYIISPDQQVLYFAQKIGCQIIVEEESLCPSLNRALETALDQVQLLHPQSHIMLIQPDLPAITLSDTEKLFRLIPHTTLGFVSDHSGTGTTVLSYAPLQRIPLEFGLNSAQKYQTAGAQQLFGPWDGLQNDVDTLSDLLQLRSRIGKYTQEIIDKLARIDRQYTCPMHE